jgi:hypothetical protein
MTKEQEWLSEPNILAWIYKGYDCLIVRDEEFGNLCGYVGLKSDHPWWGKDTDDDEIYDIDVHGQIAWASQINPIPRNAYNDIWWLGFHGAAGRDYRPYYKNNWPDGTYRNMAFMKAECEKLVRQCERAFVRDVLQKSNEIVGDLIKKSIDDCYASINPETGPAESLLDFMIKNSRKQREYESKREKKIKDKRVNSIKINHEMNWYLHVCFDGDDSTYYYRCNEDGENFQERFGDDWCFVSDEEESYLRELFKKITVVAEKKPYTCECKYKTEVSARGDWDIVIDVCENKDPENIRLCKLATKIWRYLRRSLDGRGFGNVWMQIINSGDYCEVNTELRLNVFKTLAEEANAKP